LVDFVVIEFSSLCAAGLKVLKNKSKHN